jgi:hypothetical protein
MLTPSTIIFLISFSLMAVIHMIALELYLYWHFHWFDVFMHFFGGAVVALGFFTLGDLTRAPRRFITLLSVLFGVFGVALLWEVFELYAGIPIEADFVLDTVSDLLVGLCGGLVGYKVGNSLEQL